MGISEEKVLKNSIDPENTMGDISEGLKMICEGQTIEMTETGLHPRDAAEMTTVATEAIIEGKIMMTGDQEEVEITAMTEDPIEALKENVKDQTRTIKIIAETATRTEEIVTTEILGMMTAWTEGIVHHIQIETPEKEVTRQIIVKEGGITESLGDQMTKRTTVSTIGESGKF